MMSTPFYAVKAVSPTTGQWRVWFDDGDSDLVVAWVVVEIQNHKEDPCELILPCVVCKGSIEPTDLGIDLRQEL
ncbi:hypothetical protein [Xenorhabdus anantnagensis]|uniref:Uncharacterized protein n=1 Tax=Xenorhabdus anantnagensis TaxID=3025875 RepID=A0ABT5LP49_9GAMM|nr:hypothetical protein [Xenorhabdus anantnagensis]MDC9596184.1 hypothetical protein [Xenorhabdus anantnagensis]